MICKHDVLARSCDLCYLEDENESLKQALTELHLTWKKIFPFIQRKASHEEGKTLDPLCRKMDEIVSQILEK